MKIFIEQHWKCMTILHVKYFVTYQHVFIFNYREYHCRSTEAQAGWFSAFASMVINFGGKLWWNYSINFRLGINYHFDRVIVNEGSVLSQKVHMPSVTSRRHVSCMEHVPTSHHVTEPEGFINKQSVVSFPLIKFLTFIFSSGGIINI